MDRSRSPRVPLSDEARFLQRLAEPELPPGASDAERAAARADAAAGVEYAANELGGHWAEAYQELHPDWQPLPTYIEISNQRAAELTAARAAIAAAVAKLDAGVSEAHEAMDDPARDSSALRRANNRMAEAYTILSTLQTTAPQQPARTDMCERCGLHPTCGMSVSSNGSGPPSHLCRPCYDAETQPQQPHAFNGQGRRLDE